MRDGSRCIGKNLRANPIHITADRTAKDLTRKVSGRDVGGGIRVIFKNGAGRPCQVAGRGLVRSGSIYIPLRLR